MCWSVEASAALTLAGAAGCAYGTYTKQPKELVITLGYFTLMEFFQALSYPVIDSCELPRNQYLTALSFVHIAFQPFIVNMLMMYFIPPERRKKIRKYVYALCGIATLSMLAQFYPFAWAGSCIPGTHLCGSPLCSVSGNWHLAWNIPLNGLMNNLWPMPFMALPGYFLACLVLPFIYGSWRANTYHIILGPLFAYLLTNNINEAGAIWCTFSIALLLSVAGEKPIRKYLFVS